MIKLYPTRIEAMNEADEMIFVINSFDQYAATIEIKSLISEPMLDELFDAIRKSVKMLDLDS